MSQRWSSVRMQSATSRLKSALASAALEWLLIMLLFANAIFAYLVTTFARLCGLQTPCLLCSRLDHLFEDKKPGFYKELICAAHKSEISSLVYCRIHEKLTEAHSVCEICLLSCAREHNHSPAHSQLLVGKLCQDLEFRVEDGFLVADNTLDTSPIKRCSCCSSPFNSKTFVHKSVQTEPLCGDAAGPSCPFNSKTFVHKSVQTEPLCGDAAGPSCPDFSRHTRWNYVKMRQVESSLRAQSFDPLSHIGYTELKITSDAESQSSTSDDDARSGPIHEADYLKEDNLSQSVEPESGLSHMNNSSKAFSTKLEVEKLIHQAPISKPSGSGGLLVSAPHNSSSVVLSPAVGHGLEELNWDQVAKNKNPTPPADAKIPAEESKEKLVVMETGEGACASISKVVKIENGAISNNSDLKLNQSLINSTLLGSGSLDINEAYKLAVGHSESHLTFTEPITGKDVARVHDELKLLLSQISASRGFELAWNDISPGGQGPSLDLKTSETSGLTAQQPLPKRYSIERNESGFESLDGSILSEIEGESAIDRLKRQIERDHKSMSALYKELEEERSASAIAANQAMAMINRLQQEKAATQMEALQYQRMMEEQAEYDQEALQKANDLLSEREKELQDLEAELENYRKRFEEESVEEKILEPMCDLNESDFPRMSALLPKAENKGQGHLKNKIAQNDSILAFEDEKSYILRFLKRLEKKLQLFSNHGVNGHICGIYGDEDGFLGKGDENAQGLNEKQTVTCSGERTEENGGSSLQNALGEEEENLFISNTLGNRKLDVIIDGMDTGSIREPDFASMESEVSHLAKRLEILESDRDFLEHTVNSLRNGNEGLHFVQEIACHLRELRRIGIQCIESTSP